MTDFNRIVKIKHIGPEICIFNLIIIEFDYTVERFQTRIFLRYSWIRNRLAKFFYGMRRDRVAYTIKVEIASFRWSFICADSRLMIIFCAHLENF